MVVAAKSNESKTVKPVKLEKCFDNADIKLVAEEVKRIKLQEQREELILDKQVFEQTVRDTSPFQK